MKWNQGTVSINEILEIEKAFVRAVITAAFLLYGKK